MQDISVIRSYNDVMNSYSDIVAVETEISGYRRTCVQVSIRFDRKQIAWRDSLQWNNNFTRSLSEDCIKSLEKLLPLARVLEWETSYETNDELRITKATPTCGLPEQWLVRVIFKDGSVCQSNGRTIFPPQWREFREFIETASRTPFRLR